MAKMFIEVSEFTLQFKSTSDPSEVIEFQLTREFDTEEEAEEFSLKIQGICAPIHEAGQYEVEVGFSTTKTDTETPRQP